MAQHTDDPHQVVVQITEERKIQSHFQQRSHDQSIESPERKDLRVPFQGGPSSACSPKHTDSRHRDLSNRRGRGEEIPESFTRAAIDRRNSKLSSKTLKSRLEDPTWGYDQLVREDDDWLLDEDFLGVVKKTSLLLYVFQVVSLVLIIMIFTCTLLVGKLKNCKLWDVPLWEWEILIAVIISGHLVSGWVVRGVVFSIEKIYLSDMKILYLVYGIKKAVQNCIWLGLIVIAWHFLVAEKMAKETHNMVLKCTSKVLICLLVGSLVWLVKVVIVKLLASSFHDKKFFERAKRQLFDQYIYKRLSMRPREQNKEEDGVRGKAGRQRFSRSLRSLSEKLDLKSLDGQKNKRKGSAPPVKSLIRVVQSGLLSGLSTLDEFLPDSSDEEDEISLASDARKRARSIFQKIAKGSRLIRLEHLKQYLRDDQEASKTMYLLKGAAESEGISEEAFTTWMVNAFRERKTLQYSLNDSKTAVDELHHLMNAIVAVIIVIIWLIIFELHIAHFLVLVSSQLLLVVFIFGNTCRMVFEAIIFLFVMHPFDVGDRCEIDQVQMVVEEMNILTTVFERYDNQKVIYPNSVLATKPIGNYHRSSDMGDEVEFSIHISTSQEKINSMRQKIKRYIEEKDEYWYRDPVIIVKYVEDMNRLRMVVWPRHKMNYQDILQRWIRRASLIDEMIKIFRELDIEYRMLPLDLNVRNMVGTASHKPPSIWTTCYG